jgi:type VI secretion system secreted protein VgrG
MSEPNDSDPRGTTPASPEGADAASALRSAADAARTATQAVDTARQLAGALESPTGALRALQASDALALVQAAGVSDAVLADARRAADTLEALGRLPGVSDALGGAGASLAGLGSLGGAPLPPARFTFTAHTHAGAPIDAWRVVGFQADERLSELYTCTIELAADLASAVDSDALLGASGVLTAERGTQTRRFCGVVRRVEQGGVVPGHRLARVTLVPALWGLGLRTDSRIFQNQTVPQIVAAVLGEGLRGFQRTTRAVLHRQYPRREFCAQYRESDLDFVRRLLADEGIAFYFEHTGDREVMVLLDGNTPYPALETADHQPLRVLGPEADTADVESLRSFHRARELRPTTATVRDFDWTQPDLPVHHTARTEHDGVEFEHHAAPTALTVGEYDDGAHRYTAAAADARTQAELLRQALAVDAHRGHGQSNVTGLTPGQTFTVADDPAAAPNRPPPRYLVTAAKHTGRSPEVLTSDVQRRDALAEGERYHNDYEFLAADVPFRPARLLRRATIAGPQTAIVTGPANEEIHTDVHGRVRVRFHWERRGLTGDRASAWVRVAQLWAGGGFGAQFIPRVGMEVVVEFLDGDPDRPLITGCVYNGQNQPPYALPGMATRSGIKTDSSPHSGGHNELRFEDAAGREEVCLRAERDLTEYVGHNHHVHVHANESVKVDGSQNESIGGAQVVAVHGPRVLTAARDNRETVQGNYDMTGVQRVKLTSEHVIALNCQQCQVQVYPDTIMLMADMAWVAMRPNGIVLTKGASTIEIRDDHISIDSPLVLINSAPPPPAPPAAPAPAAPSAPPASTP